MEESHLHLSYSVEWWLTQSKLKGVNWFFLKNIIFKLLFFKLVIKKLFLSIFLLEVLKNKLFKWYFLFIKNQLLIKKNKNRVAYK